MSVLYYTCKECGSLHRVERLEGAVVARSWFCPGCGRPVRPSQNNDLNYWYHLTEACGLPANKKSVKLIREIYSTWDTNEYRKFTDYVQAIREGIRDAVSSN